MYNTFSISFFCRPSKVNKKGLAPIEVRVTINGNSYLTSLPRKAKPADFKRQMLSRQQTDVKTYTSTIATKIQDLQIKLLVEGRPFSVDALRNYIYYGFTEQRYTIGALFQAFLTSQMKKVSAGKSTYRNYRKYEIVRDLFYAHSGIKADSPASTIKNRTIQDFYAYLLTTHDETTVAGMLQKLKSVVLYGLQNNMITDNPFQGFKIPRKEKEVQFLTQEEVRRIRAAVMPTIRLAQMKDLFLFQCFTAISYCDMMALIPSDYKKNEYGHVYIVKPRAKTGVKFCAILFEDALEIAERYEYRLPHIVMQNYNTGLKTIGDICHIEKPMHSHIGRHTAACYLLNEKGLSLEVTARILGHNSTKLTKHYAKLFDNTVFEAVRRAEGLLSGEVQITEDIVREKMKDSDIHQEKGPG